MAEVVQPVGAAPDVHGQVGLAAEERRRRRRRLGARALHVREVAARPAQCLVRAQVVHAEACRGRRVEGEQRQPCSGRAAEGWAPEASGQAGVPMGEVAFAALVVAHLIRVRFGVRVSSQGQG